MGSSEQGRIVERFCGDLRIAQNRDINHLLYLLLYFTCYIRVA